MTCCSIMRAVCDAHAHGVCCVRFGVMFVIFLVVSWILVDSLWRIFAKNFVSFWIRFQFFPDLQVSRIFRFQSGKEETGMTNRPFLPIHNIPIIGPFSLVCNERRNKFNPQFHAPPAGGDKLPKVILLGGGNLGNPSHRVHYEEGISVGLGPLQFGGETAMFIHHSSQVHCSEL